MCSEYYFESLFGLRRILVEVLNKLKVGTASDNLE